MRFQLEHTHTYPPLRTTHNTCTRTSFPLSVGNSKDCFFIFNRLKTTLTLLIKTRTDVLLTNFVLHAPRNFLSCGDLLHVLLKSDDSCCYALQRLSNLGYQSYSAIIAFRIRVNMTRVSWYQRKYIFKLALIFKIDIRFMEMITLSNTLKDYFTYFFQQTPTGVSFFHSLNGVSFPLYIYTNVTLV